MIYSIKFFRYILEEINGKVQYKVIRPYITYYYDDIETIFEEAKKHIKRSYGYIICEELKMKIDNFQQFKKDMLKNGIILDKEESKY